MLFKNRLVACLLVGALVFSLFPLTVLGAPISFDEWEEQNYLKPELSPMESPPEVIVLDTGGDVGADQNWELSLNGAWQMAEGGTKESRLALISFMADSNQGAAGKVFDKDHTTFWESSGAAGEHWVGVDMGGSVSVNKFTVVFPEDGVIDDYFIEASADGGTWTTLSSVSGNTEAMGEVVLEDYVTYRYFRVKVDTTGTAEASVRLAEIRMYTADVIHTNLALNQPVQADSHYVSPSTGNEDHFKPEYAVDGKWNVEETDEWVSTGDEREHWLIVDLGMQKEFDRLGVYTVMANGGSSALSLKDWRVEVRDDESKPWSVINTVTGNEAAKNFQDLPNAVAARYVRLYITNPGADNFARLFEFEIIKTTFNQREVNFQNEWEDAIEAKVPGSIHTALYEAGVIEDPYYQMNDAAANAQSQKTWWLKTAFEYDGNGTNVSLNFDGVCDRADFWLNGQPLGNHQGMFGGPYLDVSQQIRQGENELVVRLNPAISYRNTVIFNCTDGWHYARIWPLGIWRDVTLSDDPEVDIVDPFIATKDAKAGRMDLSVDLKTSDGGAFSGTLKGKISPKNFEGKAYTFSYPMVSSADKNLRLQFDIPNPRLWWPNNYGDQNLYWMELSFVSGSGEELDYEKTSFGIRTIEMQPTPEGASQDKYNWTFVINGKKLFLKGTGWCTNDALMRFDEDRYDRILSRSREQGIQIIRAWGGGMPETKEFYDLCDEYGIGVYQEWPTCWDSYTTQPADVLYETVELNTKRLRNHPSLLMWGGGNEGAAALTQPVLNHMGKLTIENDGTRPWHRQDPHGRGSSHNYNTYWGGAPLDSFLNYSDTFIGEFGLASMPNMESIRKYATDQEIAQWPVKQSGAVMHHTPIFGNGTNPWASNDIAIMTGYAQDFIEVDSVESLVTGSQLAQAVGIRHTLERSRTLWPNSTGIAYYKMNDVYPAASWSTVDWYGAPKIGHYFFQDSYAPLAAVGLFDSVTTYGRGLSVPIWLLDDMDVLSSSGWRVNVRAYNGELALIKQASFEGRGTISDSSEYSKTKELGSFELTAEQTRTAPLFVVTEVVKDGELAGRNYYFINYDVKKGSLFTLPLTTIEAENNGNVYTVRNTGNKPAVAVYFDCTDTTRFIPEDNYFWLEPGEEKRVAVNSKTTVNGLDGWNTLDASDTNPPTAPGNVAANAVAYDAVELTWTAASDAETEIIAYEIYRGGQKVGSVTGKTLAYMDAALKEETEYTYIVRATDKGGNTNDSAPVAITTLADTIPPKVVSIDLAENGEVTVVFDEEMDAAAAETTAHYTVEEAGGAQVNILSATLGQDNKTVVLETTGMDPDKAYTLTITGVADNSRAKNEINRSQWMLSFGLRAYWQMDEGSGDTVREATGNAGDLTNNGGAWVAGKGGNGHALHFDANDSQYAVGMDNTDLSDDFTIFTRIKPEDIGGTASAYQVFVAKGPKDAGHFEIYINQAGGLEFYAPDLAFTPAVSTPGVMQAGYILQNNQWYDIGVTKAEGTVTVYVNGLAVASAQATGGIQRETESLYIGKVMASPSFPMKGTVDEVRLYNKAMSGRAMAMLSGLNIPVQSIAMKDSEITIMPGESYTASVVIMPDNATEDLVWASRDETVAVVTPQGIVKGIGPGQTKISATAGQLKAEMTVHVTKAPEVRSVTFDTSGVTLVKGARYAISATVDADPGADTTLTWTSSDEKVAAVSQTGVVSALDIGQTTIRAQAGGKAAEMVVEVVRAGISLSRGNLSLKVGESETLYATTLPQAKSGEILWESADLRVVKVDQNGRVTALGVGETDITASYRNVTAKCHVVVTSSGKKLVHSISLDPEEITLVAGSQYIPFVEIIADEHADKTITWSSSNGKITSVSQNGVIRALAAGSAVVRAAAGDKYDEITVKVVDSGISLDRSVLRLTVGQTATLTAATLPQAKEGEVTWKSADNTVAMVDANGRVTAAGIGKVMITAGYRGHTAQCEVHVYRPGTGLPKTGDAQTPGLYIVLVCMAFGAVGLLLYKRKKAARLGEKVWRTT